MKQLRSGQYFGAHTAKRGQPDYKVVETICPGNSVLPLHQHDRPFFSYLISGTYHEGHGDDEHVCKPNMTVFHPPGDYHELIMGREDVISMQIEIANNLYQQIESISPLPDHRIRIDDPTMAQVMGRIHRELKEPDDLSGVVIQGLVLEALAFLARYGERGATGPGWLARALQHMQNDYDGNLSIAQLANEAGVHPSHFSTVFREQTGQTPGEYLKKLRVARACQLISGQKLGLSDVAQKLGFSDQSHLTRVFRSEMGMTPGAYRRGLAVVE